MFEAQLIEPNLLDNLRFIGARAGSLYRNSVARTHNLGAPSDRVPIRQQPCSDTLNLVAIKLWEYLILWEIEFDNEFDYKLKK